MIVIFKYREHKKVFRQVAERRALRCGTGPARPHHRASALRSSKTFDLDFDIQMWTADFLLVKFPRWVYISTQEQIDFSSLNQQDREQHLTVGDQLSNYFFGYKSSNAPETGIKSSGESQLQGGASRADQNYRPSTTNKDGYMRVSPRERERN